VPSSRLVHPHVCVLVDRACLSYKCYSDFLPERRPARNFAVQSCAMRRAMVNKRLPAERGL
jgi:hypothetical protein